MDRFDRRRWQAELCRTQEELDFALDCFGVRGKRGDHVYTIGKAEWVHDTGRFAYSGIQFMKTLGISYGEMQQRHPGIMEECPEPSAYLRSVTISDPVILVFADSHTLELALDASGLLVSSDLIPPDVVNGINNQNYAPSVFWSALDGIPFEGIQIEDRAVLTWYRKEVPKNARKKAQLVEKDFCVDKGRPIRLYKLFFTGNRGLLMTPNDKRFRLTQILWKTPDRKEFELEEITCQELRKATDRYPFDDGEILESFSFFTGHGRYWPSIIPVSDPEQIDLSALEGSDAGITLYSRYGFDHFLSERRGLACRWSEDTIVFPLKAFDQILDDIEFCAEMLSTNFYDHSLDGWKKRFTGLGTVDDLNIQKEPDELELYEKLDLILDFYERLVYRLRIMAKDAAECGYILFLGCVFVQKKRGIKY